MLALGIWFRGPAIEAQINQLQVKLPQAAKALTVRMGNQGNQGQERVKKWLKPYCRLSLNKL
jgi:hypothetical protein